MPSVYECRNYIKKADLSKLFLLFFVFSLPIAHKKYFGCINFNNTFAKVKFKEEPYSRLFIHCKN